MIVTVTRTGSTNTDLVQRLRDGSVVPEGDWLIADRQDAGRGRMGRNWSDGEGNFMGSTLVLPNAQDPEPASLAFVSGLALYETLAPLLRTAALRCQLKWPNDVLVGQAKLAGILIEAEGAAVIVGIGVNLRSAPDLPDRATTSLADLGVTIERDSFAEELVRNFAAELARWRQAGLAPMLRRWQSAAHPAGTRLRVHPPGEEVLEGDFAGLAQDGTLRLSLPDGSVRSIRAGDVFLVN